MHERHLEEKEEEEEEVRSREAAILLFIFLYVINKGLLSHGGCTVEAHACARIPRIRSAVAQLLL